MSLQAPRGAKRTKVPCAHNPISVATVQGKGPPGPWRRAKPSEDPPLKACSEFVSQFYEQNQTSLGPSSGSLHRLGGNQPGPSEITWTPAHEKQSTERLKTPTRETAPQAPDAPAAGPVDEPSGAVSCPSEIPKLQNPQREQTSQGHPKENLCLPAFQGRTQPTRIPGFSRLIKVQDPSAQHDMSSPTQPWQNTGTQKGSLVLHPEPIKPEQPPGPCLHGPESTPLDPWPVEPV